MFLCLVFACCSHSHTSCLIYFFILYSILSHLICYHQFKSAKLSANMSEIMLKSFNIAVEAVTRKQIVPVFDLAEFLSRLSADDIRIIEKNHLVKKFFHQVHQDFESTSLSQKRKFLIGVCFCCHLECACNSSFKELIVNSSKHVVTFLEQSATLVDKKVAYLTLASLMNCCCLDIGYLLVNSLIKDLSSKYPKLIQLALQAVTHLKLVDTVPMLCPIVEKRLTHTIPFVQIDAIYALHALYQIAPEFVHNAQHHVKTLLSSRSPQVMAASLPYISRIIKVRMHKFSCS